jgi:hypothetical protein
MPQHERRKRDCPVRARFAGGSLAVGPLATKRRVACTQADSRVRPDFSRIGHTSVASSEAISSGQAAKILPRLQPPHSPSLGGDGTWADS